MRTIATLLLMALATGCVASGAPAPVDHAATPAPPHSDAAASPPAELYHGKHAYDAPPVSETEVKAKFVVPNGTTKLSYSIAWSSKSDAAVTIPDGAVVKLKDASGKVGAKSAVGPGPLPKGAKGTIDAPRGGDWIVEYEGYAPGVTAMVVVASA